VIRVASQKVRGSISRTKNSFYKMFGIAHKGMSRPIWQMD